MSSLGNFWAARDCHMASDWLLSPVACFLPKAGKEPPLKETSIPAHGSEHLLVIDCNRTLCWCAPFTLPSWLAPAWLSLCRVAAVNFIAFVGIFIFGFLKFILRLAWFGEECL